MTETTDADHEATIRAWVRGRYPPDFPPMDDWPRAIVFLLRKLDEARSALCGGVSNRE